MRIFFIGIFISLAFQMYSQNWYQLQQITVPDSCYNAKFGEEVVLSDSFVAIGAPHCTSGIEGDTQTLFRSGAVYIYKWDGHNFNYWQKIASPERQNNALFGSNILLSSDQLVVGSYNHRTQGNLGAVYAYKLNQSGRWVHAQSLMPSDSSGYFGQDLDIYGDFLAIGSWIDHKGNDGDTIVPAGAVYIYKASPSAGWIFKQKLTGSTRLLYDKFGQSLDLFENRLLVGTPGRNNGEGAVYMFELKRDSFKQVKEIHIPYQLRKSHRPEFGSSVLLDKNQLFIGSPGHDFSSTWTTNVEDFGLVYRFDIVDTGVLLKNIFFHTQQSPNCRYGSELAFNSEFLFIGSPFMDAFHTKHEQLRSSGGLIFKTSNFIVTGELLPSELASGDAFARSISLHNGKLAVGSPSRMLWVSEEGLLTYSGAVYIFKFGVKTSIENFDRVSSLPFPNPTQNKCTIKLNRKPEFIQVSDATGSLISSVTIMHNPNSLIFDFTSCKSGIYFIHTDSQVYKLAVVREE
jgi:hypothetical protein